MVATNDDTARGPKQEPDSVQSAPEGGLLGTLVRFVESLVASADGLIEVHADRLRLSIRRKLVKLVLVSAAALCSALWIGAATLATFRGVCGGFASLAGGRAWLGDLAGGLCALALVAATVALVLQIDSRRELARLKVKYERIRSRQDANGQETRAAADSRGAPRPAGGAGAAAADGHAAARG